MEINFMIMTQEAISKVRDSLQEVTDNIQKRKDDSLN